MKHKDIQFCKGECNKVEKSKCCGVLAESLAVYHPDSPFCSKCGKAFESVECTRCQKNHRGSKLCTSLKGVGWIDNPDELVVKKRCEVNDLIYTSNPPQNKCKNCGKFWTPSREETPICHAPKLNNKENKSALEQCLEYCREQNGMSYCKNCGLEQKMINDLLASERKKLIEKIDKIKDNDTSYIHIDSIIRLIK